MEKASPLAHCVEITWYAGGLFVFFARQRIDIYFGSQEIPEEYEGCEEVPEEEYEWCFEPVCNTFNTAQELTSEVTSLYQSILRHEFDLKISFNVRNTIDRFMNPDSPDMPPF